MITQTLAEKLDTLVVGVKLNIRYKGEPRNIKVEQPPVEVVSEGFPYVKVFDLDKQGYRSLTINDIEIVGTL